MRWIPLAALSLVLACNRDKSGGEGDPDTGDVGASDPDEDGDGYPRSLDCDDGDAAVNPGATEVCDARDNDCDTQVDEPDAADTTSFYADADADGYGDSNDPALACQAPAGHVAQGGDCDDGTPEISPGADELCDGVDNDCDGQADEADAADASLWYPDADGDGYGHQTAAEPACSQPAGRVAQGGDCDDDDPGINPDVAEICDSIDNDCDGQADEGGAAGAPLWYADGDGDGYGDAGETVAACAQPAGYTADAADCDDSSAAVAPGADELCNGDDDDCDGTADEDPADGGTFYLDSDGDGYGDDGAPQVQCAAGGGAVAAGGDCDDADPDVSPGDAELCGGGDEDCDGFTDEDSAADAPTWHLDLDGDGHGTDSYTTAACERPTGYAAGSGDCDDVNPGVSPSADEVCNGADDDCDGTTDDDPADGDLYYPDDDGDGYGETDALARACDPLEGHATAGGDCDDGSVEIHPGAGELCDGDDNDCDGETDEDTALDAATWYLDSDGDGYGAEGATTAACDQPAGYAPDDADCDDAAGGTYPGAPEVCINGEDEDCDGTDDDGCPVDHCGTISASESWNAAYLHRVTCDVYVQGAAKPTLTIHDGARVVLSAGKGLFVGSTSAGRLVVDGATDGVTMTSAAAVPAPGDWKGLSIGAYDQASDLRGLTIEYGGGNTYGGLYLTGSSPTIEGCILRDNEGAGAYVSSGSYPRISGCTIHDNEGSGVRVHSLGGLAATSGPTFADNVLTDNGDYPIELPAAYVDQLAESGEHTGNGTDVVHVLGDDITADADWAALDVPYQLAGDVIVGSAATPLWTLSGVTLQMEAGVGIEVGTDDPAAVLIDGSTLTAATGAAGGWDGLYIGAYDDGSVLSDSTVEYGGGDGYGNVLVYDASPTIQDTVLRYSAASGLYVGSYAQPRVTGCDLSDNDGSGVYIASAGGLATVGEPTFIQNMLAGNGEHPIVLPGEYLGQLDRSSAYSGNGEDTVLVLADTVTQDATWQALDVPYEVDGSLSIQGSTRPVVFVEDGAVLAMSWGAAINVGSSSYGSLLVEGSSLGVTFTSAQGALAAPGDWPGLYFGDDDEGSLLEGAIVEYAGSNGDAAIRVSYAEPTLSGLIVRYSSTAGVVVEKDSAPEISGCSIYDNDGDGVVIDSQSALATSGGPTFWGNTITGNGGHPLEIPAEYLGQIGAGSAFGGNGEDWVSVLSDSVVTSADWPALDVPYRFDGDVYIQGSDRPHVTIEAGATLEFDAAAGLLVGNSTYGSLEAIGTATDPITFTTSDGSPSSGDWDGLTLGRYCTDADTDLAYVVVEYGGANSYGDVYWYECNGTITDSTARYSSKYGIYRRSATPTVSGITYVSNALGNLY